MDPSLQLFIFTFTSIFIIVNPFSAAFMFVTITEGDSKSKRIRMARKAAIACAIILLIFAVAGTIILNFFSITIDAFRLAGGILIARVGLEMMKNKDRYLRTDKEKEEARLKDDISIVPLAIPMLSGPGAISTTIILSQQANTTFAIGCIIFSILLTSVISYVVISHSHHITQKLGNNGKNVIERIMGLLVLVIGIQMIINGTYGVLQLWGAF